MRNRGRVGEGEGESVKDEGRKRKRREHVVEDREDKNESCIIMIPCRTGVRL